MIISWSSKLMLCSWIGDYVVCSCLYFIFNIFETWLLKRNSKCTCLKFINFFLILECWNVYKYLIKRFFFFKKSIPNPCVRTKKKVEYIAKNINFASNKKLSKIRKLQVLLVDESICVASWSWLTSSTFPYYLYVNW